MNLRTTISAMALVPLMLLSIAGYSQDSAGRKISLEEAIDLSIKNSKPLKAAQAYSAGYCKSRRSWRKLRVQQSS